MSKLMNTTTINQDSEAEMKKFLTQNTFQLHKEIRVIK